MEFIFPACKTANNTLQQAEKVRKEAAEVIDAYGDQAHQDEEVIDVLHAVETLVRIHFRGRESEIDGLIAAVTEKNTKRGYYVSCSS